MNKLRNINPEQMGKIVRTVFQMIGAAVGMFGYMTDAQWLALSGPLASLVVLGYGVWASTDTNLIASAADVPGVELIQVASLEVANAIPNSNVRSA